MCATVSRTTRTRVSPSLHLHLTPTHLQQAWVRLHCVHSVGPHLLRRDRHVLHTSVNMAYVWKCENHRCGMRAGQRAHGDRQAPHFFTQVLVPSSSHF